jgi:hypothetical protein
MTKNQKLLLGVGVLGAAGYLIYKQNQKPAVAAAFAGSSRTMGGLTFTGAPCAKSPANGLVSSLPVDLKGFKAGTAIYECCKPGVFGTAAGSTGCTNPKMTTISTLEPVNFAGGNRF